MSEFDGKRVFACVAYLAAFTAVFYVAGSFDNAYDHAAPIGDIAMRDAESALSAIYCLAAVLGLGSLWLYDVHTWIGGAIVGALTAMAAGGFHVFPNIGSWMLIAAAIGVACGGITLATFCKPPAVCTLLAMEVMLALAQVAFFFVAL